MNNEKDPIESGLWIILKVMIVTGVIMVILFSVGSNSRFSGVLFSASTGLLIGGAFFTAGGLGGFLFGIPKLLQNNNMGGPEEKSTRTVILHNDNLVQISDWLTKIIVGVGLTQLYNIPHFIIKVGDKLSNSFGDQILGRNAAIAVILYFIVIGFFFVYIWTRIYFVRLLKKVQEELDPIEILKKEIVDNKEEQGNMLKLAILNSKIERFEALKYKILNSEINFEGLKEIFKVYKPGPVKWIDDCQKGRWGGMAEVNGIKADATFQKDETEIGTYSVTVKVSGSNMHPLEGKVYFFLHDSYMPNNIMVADAANNEAAITIESYEASTIGVICENGSTVLELDLNEYPGVPMDFKYIEPLISIDALNEEKALILSHQKE